MRLRNSIDRLSNAIFPRLSHASGIVQDQFMNAPIRSDDITSAVASATLPAFVHLRVRSAYSLLQGALPIPQLAKLAVGNKFAAVALTDQNNLFGALEFSNKLADAGIQPITGLTLTVDFGDTLADPAHAKSARRRYQDRHLR